MEIQNLRTDLHQIIDTVEDTQLLHAVYVFLKKQTSDVVAYTIQGEPLTKEQYAERALAAKKRVEAGQFISEEEANNAIKEW